MVKKQSIKCNNYGRIGCIALNNTVAPIIVGDDVMVTLGGNIVSTSTSGVTLNFDYGNYGYKDKDELYSDIRNQLDSEELMLRGDKYNNIKRIRSHEIGVDCTEILLYEVDDGTGEFKQNCVIVQGRFGNNGSVEIYNVEINGHEENECSRSIINDVLNLLCLDGEVLGYEIGDSVRVTGAW